MAYYRKVIDHTLEVNGKTIRVYSVDEQDNQLGNYESDQEIDGRDIKLLTPDELEELQEYLTDALICKIGEEWDTEPLDKTK